MKVGDFEIEVTSVRTDGGWQSEAILPSGRRVISAPKTTRQDAESDVRQQAEAHLYPQRRYDVNRPFEESVNLDEKKLSPETRSHLPKGAFALPGRRYPIEDKSHARNALARVSQNGNSSEKSRVRSAVHRKYPEIGEADEAVVMHQADALLDNASSEYVPPYQNLDSDEELETAANSGFTAWEYAQRRNRQHPKLEKAVAGGPYEPLYRRHFKLAQKDKFYEANFLNPEEKQAIRSGGRKRRRMPGPKASFYPSDGGSAGGGGGITSA